MNLTKLPQPYILIVDHDPRSVRLMRGSLESAGYRAIVASDVPSALSLLEVEEPQLILLDIAVPSASGFDALRQIRQHSTTLVILLGTTDIESEKVQGLNLGADDFISKPFSVNEFLARIRAVLRRKGWPKEAQPDPPFICGDIEIDFATRRVTVRGREVDLSRTEYKLLCELVSNTGRVMLHEDLLSRVWGSDYRDEIDYLRVYIRHLRRKLEENPSRPQHILSKPGIGYMFVRPPAG